MNEWVTFDEAASIDPIEAIFMDVARAIQLTPSQHDAAEDHYKGLARHIENSESVFKDRVPNISGSGSFAIHAAIRSSVKRETHDVDAVIELDVNAASDPASVLNTLFKVVKGANGSRYNAFDIERNSRCITVNYPNGDKIDLMPVVRIRSDGASVLFHDKPGGSFYHKPVNPTGFAAHFNDRIQQDVAFARRFDSRRMLAEGRTYGALLIEAGRLSPSVVMDETADLSPLPAFLPPEQKAPRVVALQLLKRYRDKRFRKRDDHAGRRKPPSIVLAAFALNAGSSQSSLVDELLFLANYIRRALEDVHLRRALIEVRNPAYWEDIFTDRWPENLDDQRIWLDDLQHLISELRQLKDHGFDPRRVQGVISDLFGESVSGAVLRNHYAAKSKLIERGALGITRSGRVAASVSSSPASLIMPARSNTNMGGFVED